MTSQFSDFRNKQIINVTNGMRIGYVDDIAFDTQTAEVTALMVYGRLRFFGIFGRGEDMTIPWNDIEIIGEDTILIKSDGAFTGKKSQKTGLFERLFS